MDLAPVRARRKKSLFRPWNSYLAKKGVVDASPRARSLDKARQRAADGLAPPLAPLARLTTGLLDTYEGINAAYYERRGAAPPHAHSQHHLHTAPFPQGDPAAATATAARPQDAETALRDASARAAAAAAATAVATAAAAAAASAGTVAPAGALPNGPAPDSGSAGSVGLTSVTMSSGSGSAGATKGKKSKKKKKGKTESSPLSVQYCDENFDYIVRTGEMFNNRYMLEKVIGRGSFGQVVRAYDTRDNTHVAIKIIKNNSLYVEQALSEVRMTSYLNRIDPEDVHSIMRLRDKFIFRGHQCLVLELLSFSLYDLLRSTEFYGVSLNLVRKFCKQILKCLAFLARPDVNIAHCDLKPENVLLRHPQRSAIKVVDFGASCRISESMFTYVQSRFYRAPEVILGLPYATQVDVWSLGCMLIELHTGYPVFAGKDEMHQMTIIVERLGLPPAHMLEEGKKTDMFFECDDTTGEWRMKASASSNHEEVVPGSKPIDVFVNYHTGATNGRRKRVSGGHSEVDYEIFLSLAHKMLQYDPGRRITAEKALHDAFVRGSPSSRSGRESPPPMPAMGAVGDHVVSEVDPGRKAPVQRMMRKSVQLPEVAQVHTDAGLSDGEVTADVGGRLRLSKSEPAFEPLPKKTFVFKTSDWAEEVGIEPPPWRAGGSAQEEDASVTGRARASSRTRVRMPAGGGATLWLQRSTVPARRAGRHGRLAVARAGTASTGGGGGSRTEAAEQRPRPGQVALPRGHGNALLLYVG